MITRRLTRAPADPFLPWFIQYFQTEAAKKVKGITATTRLAIRTVLVEGAKREWDVDEIAEQIEDLYDDGFTKARALTIARNEVQAAAGAASHAAAQSTGLEMDKVWLATVPNDGRTRPDHEEAHRQRQPLDEPYEVGGEALMFPGDSSLGAPPELTINCRCAEGYEPRDEDYPDD